MKAGNDPGSVAGPILYLLCGPLIWAAHLLLVYVPQSGLCAFRITGVAAVDSQLISILIGVATASSAITLAVALRWPTSMARLFRATNFLEGENGSFMQSVMRLLAALSLAGVLWAGATALLLPPCPQLR
jgi:hypothetical protein